MKEIFVYVEGPSDQLGMRELFAEKIQLANQKGNIVDFYPLNGKEPLLTKGPIKALNILRNRPNSYVFLVPDLYPANKPFQHTTFAEMKAEVKKRFDAELQNKKCDPRLADRFFVHCFKYDLEVLVLASEDVLMTRLRKQHLSRKWIMPVENQNHKQPPKRIVEALFQDANMKYTDTADVPWILQRSDYKDIESKCPQNFKPFAEELFRILEV